MPRLLLFTEPGCLPDPDWVSAHIARLTGTSASISVGHVAPARTTPPAGMMLSYETLRDEWVFSCPHWAHYFGRPKNMAVSRRRFESHGPFVEVMRGADSIFVQRVARELSCAEVALSPGAIVRQKSVRSLPDFLRDRFMHARALRTHRSSHARPLTFEQRARLFRSTVAEKRYGPVQAMTLAILLGAGILTFRVGGWAVAIAARLPGAND